MHNVNTLDLLALGFKNMQLVIQSGQPAALLKLYLYGYLQGIRSSRKLESETRHNLEVIRLIEGLCPSYKTIADFRKTNSAALKASNRDFLLLCKELSLLGGETVAVDGSFFKADARLLTKRHPQTPRQDESFSDGRFGKMSR